MIKRIYFAIYTIIVSIGQTVLYTGSLFVPKWKKIILGRKESRKEVDLFSFDNPIWMHCASLGEFEQGRPVLETIRGKNPKQQIILSFFSPSGYEIQKKYPYADFVFYLGGDLPWIQNQTIQRIRPSKFIMVKYEFWWNLLSCLQQNHVPIYLISGVFRKKDYFFNIGTDVFVKILGKLDGIFLQDNLSAEVLADHNINKVNVCGDTRLDRVITRSGSPNVPPVIHDIVSGKRLIIYGSVWKSDMEVVDACINALPEYLHFIVPHEINDGYVDSLMANRDYDFEYFSDGWTKGHHVYVLNTIGLLSGLYSLGRYAYIGGGYERGIHNILEPVSFRIPIFYGPKHTKFHEAVSLSKLGVGIVVNDASEMSRTIKNLDNDPQKYSDIQKMVDLYLSENSGATAYIVGVLDF